MHRLLLLALAVLSLASCQAVRDRWDLWFVVPKNPFLEANDQIHP